MKNPFSPSSPRINFGFPTANEPIQGLGSDYLARDPDSPRMIVGIGRVIDTFPKKNSCFVLTGYEIKISCTYCAGSAANVTGGMSVYSPSVGDSVVFVYQPESNKGMIVGSVTPVGQALPGSKPEVPIWKYSEGYLPSWAMMVDPATFECEKLAFGDEKAMVMSDLVPGESQDMNESHVGTVHGKMFYRVQAGNLAAINFNQIDNVVDFVAHNFKLFNSGFKIDSFCDWGRTTTEILTSPVFDSFIIDQSSFHTIKLFSGWFAAGIAIQTNKTPGKLHAEVWNDELGIHSIRTTVSSWLSKQNGIFIPHRQYEVDDPNNEGDNPKEDPSILEPAPRKGFKIDPEDQHPAAFGCMARDYVAWQTSGEYRFKRFEKYKKDWVKEAPEPLSQPGLGDGQYADFISPTMAIPAQPTTQGDYSMYRPGEAFCGILPDGSVVLRDAWGSSIELRGGKITITNPKDTEIVSGHNTVITSGNDFHLRAQNSADIHTTNKNIRIRSGQHTMVDAKQGSIQLTALKATDLKLNQKGDKYQPSGISFKTNLQITSRAPMISNVCEGIYSVMGPDNDVIETQPLIFNRALAVVDWTGAYINHDLAKKTWEREKSVFLVAGNVMAGANGVFEKSIVVYEVGVAGMSWAAVENIVCNGIVGSMGNEACNWFVCPLDPDFPVYLPKTEPKRRADVDRVGSSIISKKQIKQSRFPYRADDDPDPEENKIYENMDWHYRTTKEYGTDKTFLWFENFWQRQYKDNLAEWQNLDKDIDKDEETVYPGKKYIIENEECYITYEEENVEKDGTPKSAQDQKEEGGKFEKKTFVDQKFHPSLSS